MFIEKYFILLDCSLCKTNFIVLLMFIKKDFMLLDCKRRNLVLKLSFLCIDLSELNTLG